LIGICGLCKIDYINRNADLSIYMFDNYINEHSEKALELLFYYGFNQLGLQKIYTDIFGYDEKKIELFDKIGMKRTGILPENYYRNGKYWDSHYYCIVRDNFIKDKEKIK